MAHVKIMNVVLVCDVRWNVMVLCYSVG